VISTFILVVLNVLNVKMVDIENAYLTAPLTDKVWNVLGPELGTGSGKRSLIVKELYGLKSMGAAFRKKILLAWTTWDGNPVFLTDTFG
jgi:hypothetical protein